MPNGPLDTAYQHVLVNHVPIIGLPFALLALAAALVLRNRQAQLIGLGLVLVASASVAIVNFTGNQAYKDVRGRADDPGTDWLDAHMDRAEAWTPAFYALAVLAVAGLVVPRWWPKAAVPLGLAVLVLGMVSAGAAGWIAQAGGQVRHGEFRFHPPPGEEAEPPK